MVFKKVAGRQHSIHFTHAAPFQARDGLVAVVALIYLLFRIPRWISLTLKTMNWTFRVELGKNIMVSARA